MSTLRSSGRHTDTDAPTPGTAPRPFARDLLQIAGVSRSYGATRVLEDVSLEIGEAEFFTLLGPSGCGKTTLLRLLAGFDRPDAGALRLGGGDLAAVPPERRPVNTVFQSYALFPHLDVGRNVTFGPESLRLPRREIEERVAAMLDLVRLSGFERRSVASLSGGQQQRVALARALACRPRLLLLDEPLSALDRRLRAEMQGELKRLQRELGITFLLVTHDREEAMILSDRIAVMRAGRIVQCADPRTLYEEPADAFVAALLGEVNLLHAQTRLVEGGTAVVELACGGIARLPARGHDPRPGAARLAIRPEHVRLGGVSSGGEPCLVLPATLAGARFLGPCLSLDLRLADGTPFRADVPQEGPGASVGSAVEVALPLARLRLLGDAP